MTLRGGFLTSVRVTHRGWYYVAALVAYTNPGGGDYVGHRYEYVNDYSNVAYSAKDRRACWIE